MRRRRGCAAREARLTPIAPRASAPDTWWACRTVTGTKKKRGQVFLLCGAVAQSRPAPEKERVQIRLYDKDHKELLAHWMLSSSGPATVSHQGSDARRDARTKRAVRTVAIEELPLENFALAVDVRALAMHPARHRKSCGCGGRLAAAAGARTYCPPTPRCRMSCRSTCTSHRP